MARVSDAHLEARRQSILAAATKVFSQKGIASATMAEIASVAGFSPGAIYRYFENKEQLAQGCMNESAEAIKHAWENPGALELSFDELAGITFAAINTAEEAIDTQMFLEQMLIAVRDGDLAAAEEYREHQEQVRSGIAYLLQRQYGEDVAGFDPEQLGEALLAFYWGARLLKLMYPGSDPIGQFNQLQQLMKRALGPAPTG